MLLSLAVMFATPHALAGTTIGECDNSVRTAADDKACACITEAMAAVDANGGVRSGADYSAWQGTISYPKTGSSAGTVTVAAPTISSYSGSCFDMVSVVDTASWGLRYRRIDTYAHIAGEHADGFAVGIQEFDYAPTLSAPLLSGPWGVSSYTRVPSQFGTWTTVGSTNGTPPEDLPFPGILLDPLDLFTLEMRTEDGESLGTLHTQGQPPAGASLHYGINGELEMGVFFDDGTHVNVDGLGPGSHHFL